MTSITISNSDTPETRRIYRGYRMNCIQAPRSVGARTRISTGGYRHPEMHHIRLINGSHFCATNMEEVRVLTATRNTGGKAWQ